MVSYLLGVLVTFLVIKTTHFFIKRTTCIKKYFPTRLDYFYLLFLLLSWVGAFMYLSLTIITIIILVGDECKNGLFSKIGEKISKIFE